MMQTSTSGIPALQFRNTAFDIIDRDGTPWLQSSQIAEALGYSRSDKISEIYARHADEFTEEMTLTLKLRVSQNGGQLQREVRIFSPRGCYALGMFARTPVAAEFRKWVLDVLEGKATIKSAQRSDFPLCDLHNRLVAMVPPMLKTHSLRQAYEIANSVLTTESGVDVMSYWPIGVDELDDAIPRLPGQKRQKPKDKITPEEAMLSRMLKIIGNASKYKDVKFTKALKAGKMPDGKLQGLMKCPLLMFKPILDRAIEDGTVITESGRSYGIACAVYALNGGEK